MVVKLVETLVRLDISALSGWSGIDPPSPSGWPQDITQVYCFKFELRQNKSVEGIFYSTQALNILMCHEQAAPICEKLSSLRDDELALFFEELIQRVEPVATETVKRDLTTELRGSYK